MYNNKNCGAGNLSARVEINIILTFLQINQVGLGGDWDWSIKWLKWENNLFATHCFSITFALFLILN